MRAVIKPLEWTGIRKNRAYVTAKEWYDIMLKNGTWRAERRSLGGFTTIRTIFAPHVTKWDSETVNTLKDVCQHDYECWIRQILARVSFVKNGD